jgi:DNA polymerase-3 subunit alpha
VKEEKLQSIVDSAVRDGITILPPQINESGWDFNITDDGELVTPLTRVKGVAERTAKALFKERSEYGPFTSIKNVHERIPGRMCTRLQTEHLNRVGAFATVEPGQLPADDLTRLRDQMVLMPGLSLRPVPAMRECDTSKTTLLKLKDIADEVERIDEEVDHVQMVMGRKARMAFIADAPTMGEVNKGKFGYGNAYTVVHRAMQDQGLDRNDAYWTGLLKKTKDGKIVSVDETKTYNPILKRELDLVRPPVIVTLGSASARYFVPDLKGSIMDYVGQTFYNADLDATIVIGFNPGMIHFDPDKEPLLQDVIATAASLVV